MTAGKEHFLGNCEHLGVNGLALRPGCLYSNAPNINQFRKNRKKNIQSTSTTWCHFDTRPKNILDFLTISGNLQETHHVSL